MRNFLLLALFLSFVILEVSAKCCGRGKKGYCNDCSKVSLFGHRKCCGSGSGHGYGCNVFCCKCGACRRGHPTITYSHGIWWNKRYTCIRGDADKEESNIDAESLKDTWETFNEFDLNTDAVIDPEEFLDAIKSRLSNEEAHLLASDLLKSNDQNEIMSFLDMVNSDEGWKDDTMHDIGLTIAREFRKMDENGDGLIQAAEFDDDLK